MPLPDHAGRYLARIGEHGVNETGPNKLCTFVVDYILVSEFDGENWYDIPEDLHLRGYHYIEMVNGNLNSSTINQLKNAFGWDGRDAFWLQDQDFDGHEVQLTVDIETYEGKARPKVSWVDVGDADPLARGGVVPKADDAARRAIGNRIGAKLRAHAGGTPAPAPAPAGRPTQASAPPSAPPAGGEKAAWIRFSNMFPENSSTQQIESEWFRLLGEDFPGVDLKTLNDEQWKAFIDSVGDRIIPF